MQRPVTIRQVASRAGVSPATVSRVLAGSPRVDPRLRARTLAAIDQLAYRTNQVARALRTSSTGTIGMVVADIVNPFFPVIIQAVERQLRTQDAQLLLCDSEDDVGKEAELVASLLDHRIDGILICPCDRVASRDALQLAATRVPVVQFDRVASRALDYVGVHQDQAMAAIVAHLQAQGCGSFCYVTFSPRASTAAERLRGYRRAVGAIDPPSAGRVYEGAATFSFGQEAGRAILGSAKLPGAIVCANDLIALGVLDHLKGRGVAVPSDVLVTGFDDTLLAAVSSPTLTSMRQPLEEIGRKAAEIVLRADHGQRARPLLLEAKLVVRASSGARQGVDERPAGRPFGPLAPPCSPAHDSERWQSKR